MSGVLSSPLFSVPRDLLVMDNYIILFMIGLVSSDG
jgi:hypothetical protein